MIKLGYILVASLASLLVMESVEGNMIDSFTKEVEKVADEIVADITKGQKELEQIIEMVKSHQEEKKKNLNAIEDCQTLMDKLKKGEKVLQDAVSMAKDMADGFVTGVKNLFACGSLGFMDMGKCVIEKIDRLKTLVAMSKQGALAIKFDLDAVKKEIIDAWKKCV